MSKGLIHHIEIYVSNLKESIDFWGWLLEELGMKLSKLGNWEKVGN